MQEEEIKELQENFARLEEEKERLGSELKAKDEAIAVLRQNETDLKEKLGSVSESLSKTIAGYRMLAVRTNPDVPAELIDGDTIETIDKAVENAWSLVNRVKEKVEKGMSLNSIPAGAPPRTPPDLSSMGPREKIQWGISKK